MIVVDTSVLMAILLDELEADACSACLRDKTDVMISAGTLTEALIVATSRNVINEMVAMLDELGLEVVPVLEADARRIGTIYAHYGKGFHAASLNFGDCFAYALAKERASSVAILPLPT